MNQSNNNQTKYLGYKTTDFETKYAKYYNETIDSVPMPIAEALNQSPYPMGSLPPLSKVRDMLKDGYENIETGYTCEADGSLHVVVLTKMPNVSPKMWAWWFGWHGDLSNKYKLWHPRMHVSAVWQDGEGDMGQYIGRTSMIEEYIVPNKLEKANIRFISPTELGFQATDIADTNQNVFICARLGYTHYPIDFGYLVHHIRPTEGGAEMRSRFFMGGKYIQLRMQGWLPNVLSKLLQRVVRLPKKQGHYMLVHCAEEMNHLSAFLPKIYTDYH